MSYSFTVKAATKALALEAVAAEMQKVVASQPVHARDEAAVNKNAAEIVALLPDDDTKDVTFGVNGYVSWSSAHQLGDPDFKLSAVSVAVSAALIDRKAE